MLIFSPPPGFYLDYEKGEGVINEDKFLFSSFSLRLRFRFVSFWSLEIEFELELQI